MNIETMLNDFDIVRSHILDNLRKGTELPLQYDVDNFNKAHRQALYYFNLGILNELSQRIQKGVI